MQAGAASEMKAIELCANGRLGHERLSEPKEEGAVEAIAGCANAMQGGGLGGHTTA